MTVVAATAGPDLFGEVPADTITRGATLSKCRTMRYTLTRQWNCGRGRVCWIMLNPSTADGLQDDPTIRRCIRFSQHWGARELVVVNLYPFRSSSPVDCRRWADWERGGPDWHTRDVIHFVNLPLVVEQAKAADRVIAAWGAGAWDLAFVDHVVEEIQANEEPWPDLWCLGRTSSGAPIHPLARGPNRVPDAQKPLRWRPASWDH